MICLSVAENTHATIYLDVHHVEKNSRNPETFSVSGTLGDGPYEGEVLLEISDDVEVTFVDSWMDQKSLRRFFDRNGREMVCAALREAANSMVFRLENLPTSEKPASEKVVAFGPGGRPLSHRPRQCEDQMNLPMKVAAGEALWQAVV